MAVTARKHDATIIVLGKKLNPDETLSQRGLAVTLEAASRHKDLSSETHSKMVLAGSHQNPVAVPTPKGLRPEDSEAKAMEKVLIEHGVPKEDLVLSEKGTNLALNLHFARKVMEQNGLNGPIEIHVDGYQSKRTSMIAKRVFNKKAGWEFKAEVIPVYTPRSMGRAIYETLIYEPIETAFMWGMHQLGYVKHLITGRPQYGK